MAVGLLHHLRNAFTLEDLGGVLLVLGTHNILEIFLFASECELFSTRHSVC